MKKRILNVLPLICLLVAVAVLSSTVTLYLTGRKETAAPVPSAAEENLEALESLILTQYYRPAEEADLMTGAMRGMVASLDDPYSYYYTAEEMSRFEEDSAGQYHGVGMLLSMTGDGSVVVLRVFRDSPAEKAGVLPGDEIISVEGKTVHCENIKQFNDVIDVLRRDNVQVSVLRNGAAHSLTLVQGEVHVDSVHYEILDNNVGYLAVYQFSGNAVSSFEEALSAFREAGVKGFVVDLRDNPGGLLKDVVNICDAVLPETLIVYTEDRAGRRSDFYSDQNCYDTPMVVLVNGMSASASEIFAAAVQDTGRGLVVGEKTYGKGVVQTVFELNGGNGLQLTTAAYFTPSGRSIHENGVTPDIEAVPGEGRLLHYYSADPANDAQLQKALEVLSGLIAEKG